MYMSFSTRVLLFVLLVVEGIESNPGPGSNHGPGSDHGSNHGPGSRESRGRGRDYRGATRGFGSAKGRGLGHVDYFANYSVPGGQVTRALRRSQRLQERPERPTQLSLSQSLRTAWLTNSQSTQAQQEPPMSEAQINTDTEPENSIVDNPSNMTGLLIDKRNDVKLMNNKFDKLDKKNQQEV